MGVVVLLHDRAVRKVVTLPQGIPGVSSVRKWRCRLQLLAALAFLAAVSGCAAGHRPPTALDPGAISVSSGLSYRAAGDSSAAVDVYAPVGSRRLPMIIAVHGGGLTGGDKASLAPVSRALAGAGYVVFNVNYSLDIGTSPAFPRDVDDITAALAWSRAHAATFGADSQRVGIVGASAGGYLAAMAGLRTDRDTHLVKAVVSLSGPMDIAQLIAAQTSTCGRHCAVPTTDLLGCPRTGCETTVVQRASPVDQVTARAPAFLLANSTHEIIPAAQAVAMQKRLISANAPVQLILVPGTAHAEAYAGSIRSQALAFLQRYLEPSRSVSSPVPMELGVVAGVFAFGVLAAVVVMRQRKRRAPDRVEAAFMSGSTGV